MNLVMVTRLLTCLSFCSKRTLSHRPCVPEEARLTPACVTLAHREIPCPPCFPSRKLDQRSEVPLEGLGVGGGSCVRSLLWALEGVQVLGRSPHDRGFVLSTGNNAGMSFSLGFAFNL